MITDRGIKTLKYQIYINYKFIYTFIYTIINLYISINYV